MHLFPQLRKLEDKYPDSLVVLGVHSAKYTTEKDTDNIRSAVLRYDIRHPVVNDADFKVWKDWGIRAWPTIMFIDPRGNVIGKHEGELAYEEFDRLIGDMTAEFKRVELINPAPLPYQLEAAKEAARPMAYPGKIEVDAPSDSRPGRLFIADSNHNRVLITDLDGRVQDIIGSGEIGREDGAFEAASMWRPQGMAIDGDTVYIADAENHLVRRADLSARTLTTIAGTGEQSLIRHRGGDPLTNPLNSPYDLALHDGVLYSAQAGFHQIWAHDLERNRIRRYAGNGRENIVDGALADAELAQTYGLQILDGTLYFADSETSSVRTAGTGEDARVHTLVGTGLFDFGDSDDVWTAAKLQHVQGVAIGDGVLYLADSYNHKIKRLNLETGIVMTIAGSGDRGKDDGPTNEASFDEPAGVAFAEGRVYVADTNNNLVRVIDLDAETVSTLELTGLRGAP
ncbi:MAG: alkyl hydroperoxide reductase [Chloroflexi bacterium]|nr:alkyl hydroperoxide reductase [Chloroflexota bacterium]